MRKEKFIIRNILVLICLLLFVTGCKDENYGKFRNLEVGQSYQGGVIVYVDETGQHGLIASAEDISEEIRWNNGTSIATNALGREIGTGKSNTELIVQTQGEGEYAAKICYDLVINGFDDWFLPSRDELNCIFMNRHFLNGISSDARYWSSTEHFLNSSAWFQIFYSNGISATEIKSRLFRVRAVREF